MNTSKTKRIDVVDSLRGFSLLGILLIHFIEHFNLYYFQSPPLEPYKDINLGIWETVFFIFSGKAYIIFSFLFGFSFFIQIDNQSKLGYDFRLRYAWRLILLLFFAQLHAMFYPGDILVLYAIVGFILIAMSKASNKLVLCTAIILMLQPVEWYRFAASVIDIDYVAYQKINWNYFTKVSPVLAEGKLLSVLRTNLWEGQLFSNLWQIENGRLFQTASLFLLGMLSGRKGIFHKSTDNIRFWKIALTVGIVGFASFYTLQSYLSEHHSNISVKTISAIIIPSIKNLFFSAVLVAGYILLWHNAVLTRLQRGLIPYGKMSLTNYITMAMIGSFVYYGYGLGLNTTMNIFFSFITAIIVFLIQLAFSIWWLKHHKQGPMEYLWKKLTWIGK